MNATDVKAYDDHKTPHAELTLGQTTLVIVWLGAVLLWLLEQGKAKRNTTLVDGGEIQKTDPHDGQISINVTVQPNAEHDYDGKDRPAGKTVGNGADASRKGETAPFSTTRASPSYKDFLRNVVVLGGIMVYFYLCDYRKVGSVTFDSAGHALVVPTATSQI